MSQSPNREPLRRRPLPVLLVALLVGHGCGGPSRVHVPKLSPQDVTARAMSTLDRDGNEKIDKTECTSCPGLESAFALYDRDSDGAIGTDELSGRLQALLDSSIGRMPCMITIYANGRLFTGAKVELIPDPILGGTIDPATGTTNDKGVAKPVTVDAPPGLPGVQFGIYRVAITHPDRKVPARYNTETTLGCELSPLEREGDSFVFQLKL